MRPHLSASTQASSSRRFPAGSRAPGSLDGTTGHPRADEDDDDDGPQYVVPVPSIIEMTERGERRFDLYSRLLLDRIIVLSRPIDDRVANLITAQLLFLESQDPDKDINLYINSPGGVVTAGMAIYDTMQLIKCDVSTTVIGQAASMAAVLLSTGAKGKRFALPNARIMIHQPSGGARGQATDLQIQLDEMLRIREMLYNVLSKHTGRSVDEVFKASDRDNYMSPEQAMEFGLIDGVASRKPVAK